MPRKRVQMDEGVGGARLLARDRMMTFQELADEAFADVLKKHGRPVDLRAALRKSARTADARAKGRAKDRRAAKY